MTSTIVFCRRALLYAWKVICTKCNLFLYIEVGARSIVYKTKIVGGAKLNYMTM